SPCIRGGTHVHSCALEHILQIMVMVSVETAQCRQPVGMLELSCGEPVFSATPRLQGQPTVGPELSLGTETMRCLDQSDQKGNPDGSQLGNLSQKFMGWMLPAFPQQLPSGVAPDLQQDIELLIELLGAATHARFRQLLQPSAAMARGINFFTCTASGSHLSSLSPTPTPSV